MITLKNPDQVSASGDGVGGFYVDTIERAWSGAFNMRKGIKLNQRHRLSYTPEYRRWNRIKQKCYNKNSPKYRIYGGRGIRMYDGWLNNPKAFCEYIKNLPHSGEKGMTLDRINNDGNYEPGNLRWVGMREQTLNRRIYYQENKYVGATRTREKNKWCANIKVHYKAYNLGHYYTIEEAIIARDQFIIDNELWEYPLQILNKPDK